jgi:hypothetical protein
MNRERSSDETYLEVMGMAGKGDDPRPLAIARDEYDRRWPLDREPPQRDTIYVVGRGWIPRDEFKR